MANLSSSVNRCWKGQCQEERKEDLYAGLGDSKFLEEVAEVAVGSLRYGLAGPFVEVTRLLVHVASLPRAYRHRSFTDPTP